MNEQPQNTFVITSSLGVVTNTKRLQTYGNG